MSEYINQYKEDMYSNDYHVREKANECLLAYDLGRAVTDTERSNARKEYSLRMWVVAGYTLKEAMHLERKYR